MTGWWFQPMPVARVAVLRAVLAAFVIVDVVHLTPWVAAHGYVPGDLYKPVLLPRLLHLPTPTPTLVHFVQIALLLAAAAVLTGRLPRFAGAVLAVGYAEWMFIAMSYGKIDHDRFALLIALAVLPTAGAATWRDRRASAAAGWAIRCVQVAVVATYAFSAYAKVRWGGWGWPNSEIFYWAMSRRGTVLGAALLHVPVLLHLAQWTVLLAETGSPALLVLRGRALAVGVLFFASFHLLTFLTISIHFLPHVVCLLAFAPLERLGEPGGWLDRVRRRPPALRLPGRRAQPSPTVSHASDLDPGRRTPAGHRRTLSPTRLGPGRRSGQRVRGRRW